MFKKYLWNFSGEIFTPEYIRVIHDQGILLGGFALGDLTSIESKLLLPFCYQTPKETNGKINGSSLRPPAILQGFLGCFVSGVSTPISLTRSLLLRTMVSPSTTLAHMRICGLEQDIKRHRRRVVRIRILRVHIIPIPHPSARVKDLLDFMPAV
jgi:hypothetical protein